MIHLVTHCNGKDPSSEEITGPMFTAIDAADPAAATPPFGLKIEQDHRTDSLEKI